jgi:hypothetical protein
MAANARAEVNTHANADTPNNAILLRADIHILFDDYQWSLWVCQMSVIYFTFSNWPCSKWIVLVRPLWLFGLKSQVPRLWTGRILRL